MPRSDWMAVEQERGISVSSAVMTFESDGLTYNLLDTPGHQDFSEDTYRTLTAVDSAIMVLDAAKGIEEQTKKLFEVCRLRDVPIITFVNKLDRESRDPFDLLDEIEQTLALDVTPASWPIGMGRDFLGTYDLIADALLLFDPRGGFLRLGSGRFRRGMKLKHGRSGRMMAIQNPVFFLARDRNLAEEAWPGDIIGIPNHGTLRIGDTLSEGEALRVTGIPNFAPEILRRVRLDDPMKSKHLRKALEQLAEEGVTRIFKPLVGGDWIVGVVGALQLDVLAARIKTEYELGIRFEPAPYETARWVEADDPLLLKKFVEGNRSVLAEDHDNAPVFLARNAWELRTKMKDWPVIRFRETREMAG